MTDLLAIANDWSFWHRSIPRSIPRAVDLPSQLHPDHVLLIEGVRRAGKSTLMQQLVGHYDLDPADCLFINFEDPRLALASDFSVLDALTEDFERARPEADRVLFLDEIQGIDGWQRWLRGRIDRVWHDARPERFVVTGSSAHLLSGELGTVLTGRHLSLRLYPFDLHEHRLLDAEVTLERHLHTGGFPGILTRGPDADRLLAQVFSDVVVRDVRERVGARSARTVEQVALMAFESTGSEFSQRRVAAATGLSATTVGTYLDACEAAHLLFRCPYFAWSERKRAARAPKIYPVDTGLRRVVVRAGARDRGKSLECFVHLALRRRFTDVSYWREGGQEVDFVVLREGVPVPVQVTWEGVQERHERGFEAFYERHPGAAEPVVITALDAMERLEALGAS